MNEIQIFIKDNFEIRVIEKHGEPWFVVKDVCEALEIVNSRDSVSRLDEDEKGVVLTDTPGGRQELTIVSEPGLYSLILGSRKPEAKQFKRWITHEVIPSIRKTGSYLVQPQSIEDLIIMQAQSMKDIRTRLEKNENQITAIKDTLLSSEQNWREWVNEKLNQVAFAKGGSDSFRDARRESYAELESRSSCDLKIRLKKMIERMALAGETKTAINSKNLLDVIETDQRIKEIYTAILKEMVVKYVS
jgi:prophage antirepressor-like protein